MENNIIADLKNSYGIICNQITPVTGGWMHQKWKISTAQGELLVKQFNSKRCGRDKLQLIECALKRQIILEKNGVPCPFIYQFKDSAIRLLDHETAYMVMSFHEGKSEGPDTITGKQMESLGDACGLMHREFSKLPVLSVEGYPIPERKVTDKLFKHINSSVNEYAQSDLYEFKNAVFLIKSVIKRVSSELLAAMPKGIAHEDFSADNILFNEEGLSAIVDFDRNHYSYIWHDIGRAILSFALRDKQIDLLKVCAFIDGYSNHSRLKLSDMVNILQLTWCIEIPWWIQPEFFRKNNEKVIRFKDEMIWLTEHWFELNSIFN